MRKQDFYYIAGALIGIGIANYLTRKWVEKDRIKKCLEKANANIDKAFKEEDERHIKEMNRIAEESSRKLREIADQQMEEMARIRAKVARYKEEMGIEDDEDTKIEDNKLRFS